MKRITSDLLGNNQPSLGVAKDLDSGTLHNTERVANKVILETTTPIVAGTVFEISYDSSLMLEQVLIQASTTPNIDLEIKQGDDVYFSTNINQKQQALNIPLKSNFSLKATVNSDIERLSIIAGLAILDTEAIVI